MVSYRGTPDLNAKRIHAAAALPVLALLAVNCSNGLPCMHDAKKHHVWNEMTIDTEKIAQVTSLSSGYRVFAS